MWVLTNKVGYLMDIDDRGFIASTYNLKDAIKYLSIEEAEKDALLTGCMIKALKDCKQVLKYKYK